MQGVQQQLLQQASLHSAELSQARHELQQAQGAHAAADARSFQLQVAAKYHLDMLPMS